VTPKQISTILRLIAFTMPRITLTITILGVAAIIAMVSQNALATGKAVSSQDRVSRSEMRQMLRNMMEEKQDMQDMLPWLMLMNGGHTLQYSVVAVMALAALSIVTVNGLLFSPAIPSLAK